MKHIWIGMILVILLWSGPVPAGTLEAAGFAQKAIELAKADFDLDRGSACLTNAGYAGMGRQDTRVVFNILAEKTGMSIGKGNILCVHDRADADLWMAFVTQKSETKLIMVLARKTGNTVSATKPVNVRVDAGTPFGPFKKALGEKAFSLVTLANGWADGIPVDMMEGALFHDHLCCGVFTGYFTAGFIRDRFPLAHGDRYIYIGAPAWCQDDYIIRTFNLTPGKHGYYTMDYPWNRPWKTKDAIYDNLGGIIVRYNKKEETGQAWVLGFDWRTRAFKEWLGRPDLKLDWAGQPWLHVMYNRYFVQLSKDPENFVSIIKAHSIVGKTGLDRLIRLGANPLEEILGPDPSWHKQF